MRRNASLASTEETLLQYLEEDYEDNVAILNKADRSDYRLSQASLKSSISRMSIYSRPDYYASQSSLKSSETVSNDSKLHDSFSLHSCITEEDESQLQSPTNAVIQINSTSQVNSRSDNDVKKASVILDDDIDYHKDSNIAGDLFNEMKDEFIRFNFSSELLTNSLSKEKYEHEANDSKGSIKANLGEKCSVNLVPLTQSDSNIITDLALGINSDLKSDESVSLIDTAELTYTEPADLTSWMKLDCLKENNPIYDDDSCKNLSGISNANVSESNVCNASNHNYDNLATFERGSEISSASKQANFAAMELAVNNTEMYQQEQQEQHPQEQQHEEQHPQQQQNQQPQHKRKSNYPPIKRKPTREEVALIRKQILLNLKLDAT